MSAELIGQLSVGQCVPTTASLVAQAMVELNAKIAGILAIQASLTITPPSLGLQLTAALNLVAALEAQIALGLTLELPAIQVDLTVMLSVLADLNASLAALLALSLALGTAGVYVIKQSGASRTYGTEMQAVVSSIAPPGNNVQSVTFLATEPAVFAALGKVLLTG